MRSKAESSSSGGIGVGRDVVVREDGDVDVGHDIWEGGPDLWLLAKLTIQSLTQNWYGASSDKKIRQAP